MEIKFKKINEFAKTPFHGSAEAAGWDLYAAIYKKIDIPPHTTKMVGTGLSFELPKNTFGAIFARSGLASKKGIRPANCVGVIDADYRGECIVALHNDSEETVTIYPGDRIAQLVVLPYITFDLKEVEELDETERGSSGFGSTGTN
jgi:dUTP pyrophosphatase